LSISAATDQLTHVSLRTVPKSGKSTYHQVDHFGQGNTTNTCADGYGVATGTGIRTRTHTHRTRGAKTAGLPVPVVNAAAVDKV
jgi:hypothetical protein